MTRPNLSPLELDGNTVKLRLQANRFETCSHVHVDWLRFTCALRNAPIDEAILFPRPAKHQQLERIEHGVVDHVFWRTDADVVKRFVDELEKVDEYAPAMQALSLAREVAAKLGAEFEVAHDIGKGHDFYARRWIIQRQGKEVGWVGFGASSESPKQKRQAETIHCNLYGAACTFADPGWTNRMAALIDECQATITRCDLALDFFDGPPFTMEQIRQDLMNGVMNVRGRTPSWNLLGHWSDEARSHKRCATNLDLNLEHLMPPDSRATVMRVPDRPSAADLDAIGHGNPDSYDEERNGVLVLDELGSWLNARAFQEKGRAALIDWLIHARKKGWDVYLIVQHQDMIDKQVRQSLAEYLIRCIRADKIRIPIVGKAMGKRGKFPRMHIARIGLAESPQVTLDREIFRADDLHAGYDTRQIFKDDPDQGLYCMLSAWHLKGRHEEAVVKRKWWQPKPKTPRMLKPKLPLIARLQAVNVEPDTAWALARSLNMRGLI